MQRKSPSIFKIDGVGVNLERFYPCASLAEKIALREKYGFASDDFILIYTAEFIPRKNHKLLFDILPALNAKIPVLRVVLCGKGELLEHYKSFSAANGLDYVLFTGYTRDVADYGRLSDMLVMPSFQEGLPMAMIEAIATGLPVVASNIRGHSDVIEDCANGFLFAPNDMAGFEKAIVALYKNPALRAEIARRNIERARAFSVENAVGEMQTVYESMM